MVTPLFPGDPRHALAHTLMDSDIEALSNLDYLSTALIDFLVHRALFFMQDFTSDGFELLCANAKCQDYMTRRVNDHAKSKTDRLCRSSSERLRKKLSFLRVGKFCVIFPFITSSHYFTVVLRFDSTSIDVTTAVDIYDSIRVSRRQFKKISVDSPHGEAIELITSFLNNFVFYSSSPVDVKIDLDYLLSNVNHRLCPQQKNGIDCGLFTAGVTLHLLHGIEVSSNSFSQKNMTELRSELYHALRSEYDDNHGGCKMPGHTIRKHYPELHEECGEDPEEDDLGVEFLGVLASTIVKVEKGYESEDLVLYLGTTVQGLLMSQQEEEKKKGSTGDTAANSDVKGTLEKEEAKKEAKLQQDEEVNLEKGESNLQQEGGVEKEEGDPKAQSKTSPGCDSQVGTKDTEESSKKKRSVGVSKKKLKTSSERHLSKHGGTVTKQQKKKNAKKTDSDESWEPKTDEDVPAGYRKQKKATGDKSQNFHVCDQFMEIMKKYLTDDLIFSSTDDISAFITEYEDLRGFQFRITRSNNKVMYRKYECVTHEGCPCYVHFGSRRRDGAIVLKSYDSTHYGVLQKPTALDGRRWKKRRKDLLDDVYNRVEQNKAAYPVPADIRKGAASNQGKVVDYNQAWRALEEVKRKKLLSRKKNYELLPNYLLKLGEMNEGSRIDIDVDANTHEMRRLFVCPLYVNNIYCCLRPVISVDAAHLKGYEGGTIESFTMYTGNKELYILGFGITSGNENLQNWRYEFENLKLALPVLQKRRTDTLEDDEQEGNECVQIEEIESTSHDTLFVVDRMKGIETALKEVFPNHHQMNCGKHISANVEQKFGKKAASFVQPIGKTFSTRHEEYLLSQLKKSSPSAFNYVSNIQPRLWRGTSFNESEDLPPRFGITTSNAAEQFNSLIEDERNKETWLGVVEGIIDKMCQSISTKRQKYKNKNPNEVVPWVKQVLAIRYNAAASMKVYQVKESTFEFYVTETSNKFSIEDEAVDFGANTEVTKGIMKSRQHLVLPKEASCTCGKWQDLKFPCRHGIAYYRLWEELSLQTIEDEHVHYYYRYKALQKLYEPNICPVSSDTIRFDEVTKPPKVNSRSSGRPRARRIRNRSKFVDPSTSNISCSKCGAKGHNVRTCARRKALEEPNQHEHNAEDNTEIDNQETEANHASERNNQDDSTTPEESNAARRPQHPPAEEDNSDTDATETENSVQEMNLKDDTNYI